MKIEKQLRRIAKLGISNFETVEKVERAQADLLERLRASTVKPRRYRDLSRCSATRCGRAECTGSLLLRHLPSSPARSSRRPALLAESRAAVP